MKINVGSKNIIKVHAVREAVALYPYIFQDAEVNAIDVDVELYGHPKDINETIEGSLNRAKQAFYDCDYSFGIEGGLIEAPHTKSGYLETSACAIFDGQEFIIGLGPAYEWPIKVTEKILSGEADASLAFKQLKLTHHDKLGTKPGGIIGFLTEGRISREDFVRYSIIMALVQLEKPELYK
jgi:inosine/xanthosine triphosphatase